MSRKRSVAHVAPLLFALLAVVVVPLRGQLTGGSEDEEHTTVWTVEAFGGGTLVGRFLEQRVALPDGGTGERELTAPTSFFTGASLGVRPWSQTELRAFGAFSPSELEFEDDTGNDSELLDVDDLADLDVFLFGIGGLQYVTDPDGVVAPYLTAGLAGTVWSLDSEPLSPVSPGVPAGDEEDLTDDQFRLGAQTGIGFQVRVASSWSVRVEGNRYTLGNPFDGSDAFQAEGDTFDEPSTASLTTGTVHVSYSF